MDVVAYMILKSFDFVKYISVFEIEPVTELVARLKNLILVVPDSNVVKVDWIRAMVCYVSSK